MKTLYDKVKVYIPLMKRDYFNDECIGLVSVFEDNEYLKDTLDNKIDCFANLFGGATLSDAEGRYALNINGTNIVYKYPMKVLEVYYDNKDVMSVHLYSFVFWLLSEFKQDSIAVEINNRMYILEEAADTHKMFKRA